MPYSHRLWTLGAFALLTTIVDPLQAATDFPTKPVTLAFPVSAGSSGETFARYATDALSKRWKQPVVIENRPGASGAIAWASVAKAAPDGHTLAQATPTFTTLKALTRDLTFDPERDLVPVSQISAASTVVIVHPSIPAKDLKEFAAWAKANNGKVFYGTNGVGTLAHLILEIYNSSAGLGMTHVAYAGPSQHFPAQLRNEHQISIVSVAGMPALQEQGRLRIIASVSEARLSDLPNVPSLKESALFDYVPTFWAGWMAPKGTPRDVIDKISGDLRAVLAEKAATDVGMKLGVAPKASTPEEFGRLLQTEYKLYGEVIRRAIKPEK